MWQSILYPPIFCRVIDASLTFLFSWHSKNITFRQKMAAYSHLYSFASTKAVVHWFQIMRSGRFVMYDDDMAIPALRPSAHTPRPGYRPARFPTRNIATSVVLIYGDTDSLIDVEAMRNELPKDRLEIRRLTGYEHLDIIWGKNVHLDVIPQITRALREHCKKPEVIKGDLNGLGPDFIPHQDAAGSTDSWDGGGFSDYATSTD
jgi:lysosomal acid lipase/cholesteryl ester hydrolase